MKNLLILTLSVFIVGCQTTQPRYNTINPKPVQSYISDEILDLRFGVISEDELKSLGFTHNFTNNKTVGNIGLWSTRFLQKAPINGSWDYKHISVLPISMQVRSISAFKYYKAGSSNQSLECITDFTVLDNKLKETYPNLTRITRPVAADVRYIERNYCEGSGSGIFGIKGRGRCVNLTCISQSIGGSLIILEYTEDINKVEGGFKRIQSERDQYLNLNSDSKLRDEKL
jgi:hypothetical protein